MNSTLKVLQGNKAFLKVQKFYTSSGVLPDSSLGKFVCLQILPDVYILCQVFFESDMHPCFCSIDRSVTVFKGENYFEGRKLPVIPNYLDSVCLSNIHFMTKSVNIKSLTLSVVFNSCTSASEWRSRKEFLIDILKNMLKLVVVTSNSLVKLASLSVFSDVGLNCVFVHTIGNIDIGRITASTKLKLNKIISVLRFEQLYKTVEDIPLLGGVEKPHMLLTEIIENCVRDTGNKKKSELKLCRQVLLVGPPGCGKTILVHKVTRDCGAVLLKVAGPEFSHSLPGETERALKKVFDDARLLTDEERNGKCVILLDQVDSLCGLQNSNTYGHLVRCCTQLVSLLESVQYSKGVVVVATTDCPQLLDPSVRQSGRLDEEIQIGIPGEADRMSILKALMVPVNLDTSVCGQVAQWTPGYVAADLALLVTDVAQRLSVHKCTKQDNIGRKDDLSVWKACVAKMQPSTLRGELGIVKTRKIKFSDLGGVHKAKEALKQAVQWPLLHANAFARMGLPYPKGVLLYGPPGCAKTSLVQAIASETNTSFLATSAAEIYSPYVGDAERTLSQLFHKARLGSPSIIFIDEIDALVGRRGDKEQNVHERVLSTLLTEMDGVGIHLDAHTHPSQDVAYNVGIVVIAATNRPDKVDSALLRPGRFDRLLYIGPPSVQDRLEILHTLTSKMPLDEDVDLNSVAQMTDLYSGADLTQLCKEAGLIALTHEGMDVTAIQHKHWVEALKCTKPSLTQLQIDFYVQFNKEKQV